MNPYKVLGVSQTDSLEQIKKAYRNKARKHHPDMGGEAGAFEQVNEAYRQLKGRGDVSEESKSKRNSSEQKQSSPESGTPEHSGKENTRSQTKGHRAQHAPFSGMGAKPEPKPQDATEPPNANEPRSEFTVEEGGFPAGAAARRSKVRKRRKQTSIFTLIFGSVLGALSAVVCSFWILSNWNPAALEPFRELPLVNQMLGPPIVPKPQLVQQSKKTPEKKFFASVGASAPEKQKLDTLPISLKDDGRYKIIHNSAATPTKDHSQTIVGLIFSVTNDSKVPVRAYSGGYRLIGEGRTFEYFQGDFKKKVPGGIEPGETLRFTLKIRPTKSEDHIKAWSKNSRWEVWLTDAWTGKQHFLVKKKNRVLQPVGTKDR